MATKKQPKRILTESTRLFEIAVLAVADLGGASKSVDTEDAAIRSHELAPTLFGWRKYPEQVNLELVRVSLSDAKKQKNGQLLSGSGRDGWRLTRKGLDWIARQDATRSESVTTSTRPRHGGSIDTVRRQREAQRLEASAAWRHWRAGGSVLPADARELFRVDSYASEKLIEIKVTRLLSLFDSGSDHRRCLEAAAKSIEIKEAPDA